MKKMLENRYPHAAILFRFCKEALALQENRPPRVIDQDVGAILGYDPADCSHWKKGKKNIRSLATFKSIAHHLHMDETLLIDIVSGKVDLEEALFEYKGYGAFALRGPQFDLNKNTMIALESHTESAATEKWDTLFPLHQAAIQSAVDQILQKGAFQEAPLYLQEVIQLFPALRLRVDAEQKTPVVSSQEGDLRIIQVQSLDMRPYIRFLVAKAIFSFLSETHHPFLTPELQKETRDKQGDIFASRLLIPNEFLKREVSQLDCSIDFIERLAAHFWVSKSLMTQRFREYIQEKNQR
jgi:hypothetical protein